MFMGFRTNRDLWLRASLAHLAGFLVCLVGTGAARPAEPAGTAKAALRERIDAINKQVSTDFARLEALYKHFHTHPELSRHEVQSAARLAKEMREIGFDVTEKV